MVGRHLAPVLAGILVVFSISIAQEIQPLSEEQDYAFGHGLYKDAQYQLAYEELTKFLQKYPRSGKRPDAYFLTAECLYSLQRTNPALQRFEGFVREFPQSSLRDDALFRMGEIQFGAKNYKGAVQRFGEVLQLYPRSDLAGEAAYWLGESHFRQNNLADALKYYGVCVENYPRGRLADYALYSMGWGLEQSGEYRRALEQYRTFLEKFPESKLASAVRVRIGESHYHLKEYKKAIEYLTGAKASIAGTDERGEAAYLIAESRYNLEDYAGAMLQYQSFLQEFPGHRLEREARYSLAWTFLKEKNPQKAAALFGELTGRQDDLAHAALFRKGIAHKMSGKSRDAEQVFADVVRREPRGAFADNALYELGLLQYEAKAYGTARSSLDRLVREYSASDVLTEAYRMLGETLLAQDSLAEAARAFRSASSREGPEDVVLEALFQDGWTHYTLKKFEESTSRLALFLKRAPNHPRAGEAYFWLAEGLYQRGRFGDAAANYNKVVTAFPGSGKLVDALYGLGWSRTKLGEFAAAAKVFEEITAKHPASRYAFDAYLRLGDACFSLKEYARAAAAYRSAVRLFGKEPGLDYAIMQLARVNVKGGAPDKAITEYENLLARFPSSDLCDDARFGIGWVYFQRKDYPKAIAEFRKLVAAYPKSELAARATYTIGDAYYNQKDYASAVAAYREVLTRWPASPSLSDAINGMQYCYVLLGREEEAVRVIDAFVAANMANPMADRLAFKKGDLFFGRKRFDQAVKEYRSFLQKFPSSSLVPDAHFWIGRSLQGMDKPAEAAQAYQTVVAQYGSSPVASPALLELGLLYADQRKYADAVSTFERLERSYPGTEPALRAAYEKGAVYEASGDRTRAAAEFAAMASAHKGSVYGDRSAIALGLTDRAQGRIPEALARFAEVAGRRTDEVGAEAQFRIGETRAAQKQYKEAVTALLRVKYLFPGAKDWIARAYLQIGECYEKISDRGKAREAYQTVLQSNREDEFGKQAEKRMKDLP
jgi:tol-pal system protein YbgF